MERDHICEPDVQDGAAAGRLMEFSQDRACPPGGQGVRNKWLRAIHLSRRAPPGRP